VADLFLNVGFVGNVGDTPYATCFNGIFSAKTILKIKAPQY